MIPGVSFDDMHCTDDLGMILAEKEIGAPEVQSNFVDVPGRNGPLDFTEGLTGDVRYGARTITLTFVTNEYISKQNWADFLMKIEEELHGYRKKIIFDDDAKYYYSGRCAIDEFTTSWGKQTITIECTCDPFKERMEYEYYFAVYCAEDGSLTFYGADELPSGTYKGKTVTTVYDGADKTTSSSRPAWVTDGSENYKSVRIDVSFSGARPTRLYYFFYGFENCTEIEGLSHLNTENVTNMADMFYGCSALTSLNVSSFDTSNVTTMAYMFYGCSALTHLDVTRFNTSNVTTMNYMFNNCSGLTGLNLTHFDTANVTSMQYMFYGCSGLTSLDLKHFDTSNVTTMNYMFSGCAGLDGIDLSSFNTANVTNMSYMFRNCSALTEIDISMLDTAKVTNMQYMFNGCTNLVTIYSDDDVFVTTAVTMGSAMFTNCTNLVGGNGTTYSSSNVTYTMAHVDTASNPGYFTKR